MKRLMLQGPNWDGVWDDGPDCMQEEVLNALGYPKWVMFKGLRGLLSVAFEKPRCGWGGDEYGNPSVYLRLGLFGFVFFYSSYMQTDVELPDLGENAWVDKVYYREDKIGDES